MNKFEVNCPVCFVKYSRNKLPVVLQCGHNLCLECIQKIIYKDPSRCPKCNNTFLPCTRDKKYLVNYELISVIEEMNDRNKQLNSQLCSTHKLTKDIICIDCSLLICSKCNYAPEHKNHKKDHFEFFLESLSVQYCQYQSSNNIPKITQEVEKTENAIKTQKEKLEKQVNSVFEVIAQRFNDAKKEVLKSINNESVQKYDSITRQLKRFNDFSKIIPQLQSMNSQLKDQTHINQMSQLSKNLQGNFQEYLNTLQSKIQADVVEPFTNFEKNNFDQKFGDSLTGVMNALETIRNSYTENQSQSISVKELKVVEGQQQNNKGKGNQE